MSETIQCIDHGGWFEITLNRPDRLNSFNEEMHLALRDCLNKAQQTSARAVLLTGAGRWFCAGQDLGDRSPTKGRAITRPIFISCSIGAMPLQRSNNLSRQKASSCAAI